MSTQDTLARHLQAFTEGIEALMRDYTEASVLFTPQGPLTGLASIRAFLAGFLADSPPELLAALTLVRRDVAGEVAYILWKAEPFIPLATDTFVIRDGRILVQTFAAFAPAPAAGDSAIRAAAGRERAGGQRGGERRRERRRERGGLGPDHGAALPASDVR